MNRFALPIFFAFTGALFAQSGGAPRSDAGSAVKPTLTDTAPAALVIEFDGPAVLQNRFRTTNLGSMLAAKEADSLWTAVLQPVRQFAASIGDDVPSQVDSLLAMLKDHRGKVRIVVDLAGDENAWRNKPTISATVIVEPDGRTDLRAIAKSTRALLEAASFKMSEFGAKKLRVALLDRKAGFSLPQVIDNRLIFAVSEDIETFVAGGFPAASAPTRLPANLQKSAFAVRLDMTRILPLFTKRQTFWPYSESGEFLEAFGLGSLRDVTLAVRTAGPRVLGEVSVGFGEGERGLFAAMFPQVDKVSVVDGLAPTGEDWQSGHFDLTKLFTSAYAISSASPFGIDLEAEVNKHMGVRVVEDVLRHMDSSYLELGSLMGRVDPEDDNAARYTEPDFCFVFGLKDRVAFAKNWATCAKGLQLWEDDPAEVDGVEVHRGSLFGLTMDTLAWTIVGDRFVICYGDSRNLVWIKSLVKRCQVAGESRDRVMSAEWKRLLRYAPPGHNGNGELDVVALFRDARWDMFEGFTGSSLNGVSESILRELLPLMRRFEITRGVTMTGHDGDRWRYRVLW